MTTQPAQLWTEERVRQGDLPFVRVIVNGKTYKAMVTGIREDFPTVTVWIDDNPGLKPNPLTGEKYYVLARWCVWSITKCLNENLPLFYS